MIFFPTDEDGHHLQCRPCDFYHERGHQGDVAVHSFDRLSSQSMETCFTDFGILVFCALVTDYLRLGNVQKTVTCILPVLEAESSRSKCQHLRMASAVTGAHPLMSAEGPTPTMTKPSFALHPLDTITSWPALNIPYPKCWTPSVFK